MPEVVIDGVKYVPEVAKEDSQEFQRGIDHACKMLSRYTHRTNRDLLDESTVDLKGIVHRELSLLNSAALQP